MGILIYMSVYLSNGLSSIAEFFNISKHYFLLKWKHRIDYKTQLVFNSKIYSLCQNLFMSPRKSCQEIFTVYISHDMSLKYPDIGACSEPRFFWEGGRFQGPFFLVPSKEKISKYHRNSGKLTSEKQELGKKHCFWVFGNKSRCLSVRIEKTPAGFCHRNDSWPIAVNSESHTVFIRKLDLLDLASW